VLETLQAAATTNYPKCHKELKQKIEAALTQDELLRFWVHLTCLSCVAKALPWSDLEAYNS
jgi:hypothetical protein